MRQNPFPSQWRINENTKEKHGVSKGTWNTLSSFSRTAALYEKMVVRVR